MYASQRPSGFLDLDARVSDVLQLAGGIFLQAAQQKRTDQRRSISRKRLPIRLPAQYPR